MQRLILLPYYHVQSKILSINFVGLVIFFTSSVISTLLLRLSTLHKRFCVDDDAFNNCSRAILIRTIQHQVVNKVPVFTDDPSACVPEY